MDIRNPAATMETGLPVEARSPERDSDAALLLRYRDDASRPAFEELVRRYEGELYAYLRRFLGDSQWAEDAFQATFLQVHLKCHQYDPERPVRPWLYGIATNQAIDLQRRTRRHKLTSLDRQNSTDEGEEASSLLGLLVDAGPEPSSPLVGEERRSWLRRAVARLPAKLRTTVQLVFFQGKKYREAADELEVPVGTVKSRINAAITRLSDSWKRTGEGRE